MKKFKQLLKGMCLLIAFTCFALDMAAQAIHGNVKDNTGEAIIGATVQIVGQSKATVTDLDGNFAIDAKRGEKLKISYMGFTPQELAAWHALALFASCLSSISIQTKANFHCFPVSPLYLGISAL